MVSEEVTREVFRLLPEWQIYTFYAVTIITVIVLAVGVIIKLRRYGLRTILLPEGGFWKRLGKAIVINLANLTIFSGNRFVGLMHFGIFWGMVVLLIGTVTVTVEEDILRIFFPSMMFLHGDVYVAFSIFMDLFGLIVLAGLLVMIGRRIYLKKERMNYDTVKRKNIKKVSILDDWFFIFLLLVIIVGGFVLEGLRLLADGILSEPYSFLGTAFAFFFQSIGISSAAADAAFAPYWWFHGIVGLIFVAYLPFSKALHIFSGFLSIMLTDETAGKSLPMIEMEDFEEESDEESDEGTFKKKTFTGRENIMLDACVRCGRCHVACPAMNSGFPLSPRDFIMELKPESSSKLSNGKALAEHITSDTLWSCTTCFACMEQCPMKVEHLPFIVNLRRELVNEGEVDEQIQTTLENLARYGNSFGKSDRMRPRWSKDLDFKVADARKEEVDYLWFVGDYASYDDRLQEITRKVAKVFNHAGLSFGILYNDERNSGNDVRRIGEEGLYEMLVDKNISAMNKAKFKNIVTTDPHTYNTLKNEYSEYNGGFGVMHYTELLWALLKLNKLEIKKKLDYTVTYHDPCYLGRYNGIFDEPRELLNDMGVDLVEMERTRETTYCCGAGGGVIWMEDMPGIEERPADNRIREAVDLTDVNTLVVTCPKDYVMFGDAVKTTNNEENIVVKDIIDLVYEAIGLEDIENSEED